MRRVMTTQTAIPESIIAALEEVMTFVGNTSDWLVVKKQVLKMLPPATRSFFSRRHDKTKKQVPNDMEYAIIEWWHLKTGVRLVIPQ